MQSNKVLKIKTNNKNNLRGLVHKEPTSTWAAKQVDPILLRFKITKHKEHTEFSHLYKNSLLSHKPQKDFNTEIQLNLASQPLSQVFPKTHSLSRVFLIDYQNLNFVRCALVIYQVLTI